MVPLELLGANEPRAITDGPFGSNLTSAHYTDSGARVVRLQNIGEGIFMDAPAFVSWDHFAAMSNHGVSAGDLLIASLGEELPRACLAPPWLGPAIVKADCIRVRLTDSVDSRWVMYALQTPASRGWAKAHLHGVGRPRLGLKVIRQIPIPMPELREQLRIVEILEGHLSRLDSACSGLNIARQRLTALEAAALARAISGDLVPMAEVASIQGGIQKQPRRSPTNNSYPFLRVANVTKAGLVLDDVHRIRLFDGELGRLRLEVGDLLVVEGNGSPAQIGRAAMWDGSIADCVHQNHLIRIRPGRRLLPSYLEVVWNSPPSRRKLTQLASSSSGLHTLSVTKLKAHRLPVPSVERQLDIVSQMAELRAARIRIDSSVATSALRAMRLRRSMLTAAFSGGLTGSASDAEVIEELAEA